MKILFVLALVSFAALAWAALAIVRHIRKTTVRSAAEPGENAASLEMAQAIDLRLADVSRPKPDKETPESTPRRNYPQSEPPARPAIVDPS